MPSAAGASLEKFLEIPCRTRVAGPSGAAYIPSERGRNNALRPLKESEIRGGSFRALAGGGDFAAFMKARSQTVRCKETFEWQR